MQDQYRELVDQVVQKIETLLRRRTSSIKESVACSTSDSCAITIAVRISANKVAPHATVLLSIPIKDEEACEMEDPRQTVIPLGDRVEIAYPADPDPEPSRVRSADEELEPEPEPAPPPKKKKAKKG
jgi:hypothetical protein